MRYTRYSTVFLVLALSQQPKDQFQFWELFYPPQIKSFPTVYHKQYFHLFLQPSIDTQALITYILKSLHFIASNHRQKVRNYDISDIEYSTQYQKLRSVSQDNNNNYSNFNNFWSAYWNLLKFEYIIVNIYIYKFLYFRYIDTSTS